MILIELTAAINAAGAMVHIYVGDARFVTTPTDTPASIAFDPSVIDPGSIGLHAFSDGRTGGATRLESGEIVLANADGQYDAWRGYGFDGRPIVIRSGAGGAYPGSFATLLAGTVQSVSVTTTQAVIRLRDRQYLFTLPIRAAALYGGTNALPNGLDGVATDLKGKARPLTLGTVLNVAPPMVNTARLILEVGGCKSVDAAYSNGAALTQDADYTSQADMETNAPAAGHYRAWPAGGYIRLGSYNSEQITADVTQGASAADRTAAQIIRQLALVAGLGAGEISTADVTALDALAPATVGIWIGDASTTFANVMDQIAASVGAWYGFDSTGVLRMGRLSSPSGTPMATIQEFDIIGDIVARPPSDNDIPIWQATVNYAKNWTVQTSGIAGSAAVRKGFVEQERRAVVVADASVKNQYLLAGTLAIDTLLVSESDALAEASRLLGLYKIHRDIFDITVDTSFLVATPLRIMDVVSVRLPRFGMSGGRSFDLIGIVPNLSSQTVTLSLWG